MKKAYYLIFSLVGIIIVLSLARIALSSAFSVDGITLDSTQKQIANLDKENMILKENVYAMSSYTHIASVASSLGFVEEKTQISVGGAQPLAIRQ